MARSNRAAAPVTPPSADIVRPSQAGEYFLTRPAVTLTNSGIKAASCETFSLSAPSLENEFRAAAGGRRRRRRMEGPEDIRPPATTSRARPQGAKAPRRRFFKGAAAEGSRRAVVAAAGIAPPMRPGRENRGDATGRPTQKLFQASPPRLLSEAGVRLGHASGVDSARPDSADSSRFFGDDDARRQTSLEGEVTRAIPRPSSSPPRRRSSATPPRSRHRSASSRSAAA